MATQAVVSIVDANGHTVVKAICGCNGGMAPLLARRIRQTKASTAREVYDLATATRFGCVDCLVVMDATETIFEGLDSLDDDPLDPRYRATFDCPEFNPRWEHGTADKVMIVHRSRVTHST